MRQLCSWPGFESASEEVLRFVQKLVDFFTGDYLDVLESAHYHIVYHYDERWPKLTGVTEAEAEEEEAESKERCPPCVDFSTLVRLPISGSGLQTCHNITPTRGRKFPIR